jgi:hypothetical protein
MAACERCWADARTDAMLRGGDVVDHYHRLLRERENDPRCRSETDVPGEGRPA